MNHGKRVGGGLSILAVVSGIVLSAYGAASPLAPVVPPSARLLWSAAPDAGDPPPSGDLLLSRSVYTGDASTVTLGNPLPGGGTAVADGTYPGVWKNETPDASFGVTSPIYIDRFAVSGGSLSRVGTLAVPSNQIVTSFPSKSELALNLSTDGSVVTFMGYLAGANQLDVSNSNTPNHVDPTDPVHFSAQRAVAQFDATGSSGIVSVTPVNAYSGNNGRAAILDSAHHQYFMVGNAGNGSGTQPTVIVNNTGVQLVAPGGGPESTVVGVQQGVPGASTGFQFGYSIVQNGLGTDKSGKDDNFRGLTIFNNTLFVSKGSGSNGINTVYQVGASGTLPTGATAASTAINILPGFSTTLARSTAPGAVILNPFGLWFANPTTLYVADEGDGKLPNAGLPSNQGGLQKWVLEGDGLWHNVYTLQAGLHLGVPYAIDGFDPTLYPANDGLRNLTGRLNGDGTVTLWAVTSTVSNATDQGADPNQLVTITDTLLFASPADASGEAFNVLETAGFAEVFRGVSFVPLTPPTAMAGPNQSINVGQTVQLNGTGSFAPNTPSAALQYSWTFLSVPPLSAATFTGASSATPSFLADAPGAYVARLVVTDPVTGLASAPSQVTVSSLYIPPTADAGPGQSAIVGTLVTQTGSGLDHAGLSLAYSWSFTAVPAGSAASLSGATSPSTSFTPDLPGTYSLALVVSDTFGSSAASSVSISVITANDYAQGQISSAINTIAGMPASQFQAPGHRKSMTNLLQQAIAALQGGDTAKAVQKLNDAIVRTDGYPVRGALDAKGPSMDWITDAGAQQAVYSSLENALSVLQ